MLSDERCAELDNELVRQKNMIIELIDHADLVRLTEAQRQLDLVAGVWRVLGYDYKLRELEQRIESRQHYLGELS